MNLLRFASASLIRSRRLSRSLCRVYRGRVVVQADGFVGSDGQPRAVQILRISGNRKMSHPATAEDESTVGVRISGHRQAAPVKVESPWNMAVAARRDVCHG